MRRLLVSVFAGAIGFSGQAHAVLPEDVAVGIRVELEGTLSGPAEVTATEIELKRTPKVKFELEGRIDSVDVPGRSLVVAGSKVQVEPGAEIRDKDDLKLDFAKVREGQKIEAEGRYENGVLHATALETDDLDDDAVRKVEIEGPITEVDSAKGSFRVMGYRILVTPRTKVSIH
jgi:hypothetical protein